MSIVLFLDCPAGVSERRLLGALMDATRPDGSPQPWKLPFAPFCQITAAPAGPAGLQPGLKVSGSIPFDSLESFDEWLVQAAPAGGSTVRIMADCVDRLLRAQVTLTSATDSTRPTPGITPADLLALTAAAWLMDQQAVQQTYASPVGVGEPEPGRFQFPAGVGRLAAGIELAPCPGARSTPGGMAFLAAAVHHFGPAPRMRIVASGVGIETSGAGAVQAVIGETPGRRGSEALQAALLETNIDDMPAQILDHVMSLLLEIGALDVYFTPIQMKKNRPATMLSVLCREEDVEQCAGIIFRETTTLGLRITHTDRICLAREMITVSTVYGDILVKAAILDGRVRSVTPEYDICRRLALEQGAPLRDVQQAANDAALSLIRARESSRGA